MSGNTTSFSSAMGPTRFGLNRDIKAVNNINQSTVDLVAFDLVAFSFPDPPPIFDFSQFGKKWMSTKRCIKIFPTSLHILDPSMIHDSEPILSISCSILSL